MSYQRQIKLFSQWFIGLIGLGYVNAQQVIPKVHPTWYHTIQIGYEGVHQTGPYLHFSTVYKGKVGLEVGYGSDFLTSKTITGKYYLNRGINQFYTALGYGYFNLSQKKSYLFEINTTHLVLGYQSLIGKHIFIGTEVAIVKYLEQKFKLPRIDYSETYEWDEKNYFEVGISIGYRFSISQQLRKGNTIY